MSVYILRTGNIISDLGESNVIIKLAVLVACAVALLMNFRGEWIIKVFTHEENPSPKKVLALKYTALIIVAAAFAVVFLGN